MGRKRLFTDTEKRCAKCKLWLPRERYNKKVRTVSGLQDACQLCTDTYMATYRKSPKYKAYMLRLQADKRRARIALLVDQAAELESKAAAILEGIYR